MDKDNTWFSSLRRKFQKKFKKNQEKLGQCASLDILEEPENQENNLEENETATASSVMSAQDCEEMKLQLLKLPCYWPNLNRIEAQKILSNQPNGSFILRDSSDSNSFTLSFRTQAKTFHCRNQWSQILAADDSNNHSLIDIIEHTIKKSQSSVVGFVKCDNDFALYALRLIRPICRNLSVPVPSLQSICLAKIKCSVTDKNKINSLPLPNRMKDYVRESYANTL